MGNILEKISKNRRESIAIKKKIVSSDKIKTLAMNMKAENSLPFEQSLKEEDISFICECKKASPSKGLIADEFPYVDIAKEYEEAGAAAISVLTEPQFFLGKDTYLEEISRAVNIPLLRKDFVVEDYMIYEAKVLGASAILLICSLLDRSILKDYIELCNHLGISALVEAHDEIEIEMAQDAGARVVGVNNRNLKDFKVDMENTRRLRSLVEEDIIFVAESGIKTSEDINILREAKVDAVLIGETLMRSHNISQTFKELRGY